MTDHQPHRLKVFRELDALTGSPEVTDALLDHANAAAGERIERVVIDGHQQGVVLAGWLLTFPEVLAAVLPDLLADAWDEGHADGLHNAHEYREHRKMRNPYRPEPATKACLRLGLSPQQWMGSRAAEWDDTDRHIIRSWLRLQHHLCTKCGRPWAVHDTDHVDDYSVGYLTCTATEAIAIEQAAQHAKDEPDITGQNPLQNAQNRP